MPTANAKDGRREQSHATADRYVERPQRATKPGDMDERNVPTDQLLHDLKVSKPEQPGPKPASLSDGSATRPPDGKTKLPPPIDEDTPDETF